MKKTLTFTLPDELTKSHLGVDDDGGFCLVPHDIEEFSVIVQRWGLWRPSLITFGKICSYQVEIFEGVGT